MRNHNMPPAGDETVVKWLIVYAGIWILLMFWLFTAVCWSYIVTKVST